MNTLNVTMKRIALLAIGVIALFSYSCRKAKNEVSIAQSPIVVAHPITQDTLAGTIKGTLVSGKTYYVSADIVVNGGDTLTVQPGVTVIVLNPTSALTAPTIIINGILKCIGTQSSPITFTAPVGNKAAGAWGGLECDSSNYVDIEWTNIEYGGGKGDGKVPNATGTQYAVSCRKAGATFIFTDSRVGYYSNDGLRLNACNVKVLRSTFEYIGITGGESINVKLGTTGDFAYNVIWSSATNALKFETSATVFYPQTSVNVYNNTIINNGFRNPAKPGNGVLFDLFTKGNVYNNIFVNCKQSLRITKAADTVAGHINYGNNLFFATVDSLKNYFYPAGDWGHSQSTDLMMTDPKFTSLDNNISNTTNTNQPQISANSPAIGKGNKTYNADIGAYTSDGQGHK